MRTTLCFFNTINVKAFSGKFMVIFLFFYEKWSFEMKGVDVSNYDKNFDARKSLSKKMVPSTNRLFSTTNISDPLTNKGFVPHLFVQAIDQFPQPIYNFVLIPLN